MRTLITTMSCLVLASACTADDLALLGFDTYFVKLDKDGAEVAETVTDLAGELGFQPIHIYDSATSGFSVLLHPDWATQLRNHPDVRSVKKDSKERRTPPGEVTKPPAEDEVILEPEIILGATEVPEAIARVGGPWMTVQEWGDFKVAVIDTGVDGTHSDLNVVDHFDAVAAGGGTADDGDPNGHGTHVAGTIGARADGDGVVGMAPGVPIVSIRVLDANGSGWTTDIVAGIEWVLDNPGIQVVNLSLGGPKWDGDDPLFDAVQALEDAGVTVIIAAGNETQDTVNVSPGGYDVGVTVSAYDAAGGDQGFAWFSNYGDEVDVAAPGTKVLSTWPGGGWAELDGTSMATPVVAGAAAVYRAVDPSAGVNKVRNALLDSAESGFEGQGGEHPEPLLDAAAFWADLQP